MNGHLPRVLLVEDTRTQALMIRGMLETGTFACEVVHVPTLGEALEVLSATGAAATLLDLTLPDASGLDGVVAVRNAAPDLPIIVVTADDDEARAVKAVQLGAQDYLTKGRIDPGQLSRAVRYAIERKRSEFDLARQALHDPLTGLPNRTLFSDRLLTALAQASRRESSLAVLFLDLDGFKQVNDRLGHRAGDGVLRAVASRLLTAIRPGDTVARFGGDEFTILGTELDHPGEAEEIARRLTDALAEPFPVGTESVGTRSGGLVDVSRIRLVCRESCMRDAGGGGSDRGRGRRGGGGGVGGDVGAGGGVGASVGAELAEQQLAAVV